MKTVRIFFVCILGSLASFTATGQAGSLPVVTYKNLPADPDPQTGKYALFSLRTGKPVAASLMDTDQWDLGFRGTSVIVNGGKIRKGKGGALVLKQAFEATDLFPENALFAVDDADGQPAIPTGSGNGWYEYIFSTHELKPLPSTTLVIRTADGRYAKVEILSYYRDIEGETDAPGRYYSFRYTFQPDGSNRLN